MTRHEPDRRRLKRFALLLTILLALPILPAVLHGDVGRGWVASWRASPPSKATLSVAAAALLASDILLPVPSGPVITLAGSQLGLGLATAVCWGGMTAGACLAFALTRWLGPRVATWLADADDVEQLRTASPAVTWWLLLGTRPVPVLAEAAVLLAGLLGIPWRRFLGPVTTGNLIVALAFAAAGRFASLGGWLAPALIGSVIVPLLLTIATRQRLRAIARNHADR